MSSPAPASAAPAAAPVFRFPTPPEAAHHAVWPEGAPRVLEVPDESIWAALARRAQTQPEAVGLGLTAYLNVRLEKHTESHKRNPMDLFRASVQTWPEVVECASLTGEMDYLLRVVVADMAHYSRFIMDTLLKHPSVQDCKTSFVLDRVKATTAVPV